LETIKITVKATIPPRDPGLRKLMREYTVYKKVLIPRVREAVKEVVKDRAVAIYADQKWLVAKRLLEYAKNLPFHPMKFSNKSYWVEWSEGFLLHVKTADGEAVCNLNVPLKYRSLLQAASGKACPYKGKCKPCPFNTPKMCDKINPHRGEMELIEDNKWGWVNCHITLRLPKPQPYEPKGWVGVDVGWNKLATSIVCTRNLQVRFFNPTFHGKTFKTRIIQLRHLLKEYQRKSRSVKKWGNRLKNTIKYAVGVVAKEIVSKAKKQKAGVAMESLTFKPVSKGYLVPRYKLMVAVKTLCEREGIPFKLVPAQYTSITCPKCGYVDSKNRNSEWFKCLKCGYQTDADLAAAMNIALKALNSSPNGGENGVRHALTPKTDEATRLRGAECCDPHKGDEQ